MSERQVLLRLCTTIFLVISMTLEVNGRLEAGFLGFGGDSWKEEVLLHDGSKIIVERKVEYGGRHEIGQKPPYNNQSLVFTMPGSIQQVTWKDNFSKELGSANFLPMALDVSGGVPYLVVYPMGCLSYNKWGRPNPPYVVFRYQGKDWARIPLQELPAEVRAPNMIFSMPDVEVERFGKRFITAEMIKGVINGYRQPEFKTILREPVAHERCPQYPHGFKSPIPIAPTAPSEKDK